VLYLDHNNVLHYGWHNNQYDYMLSPVHLSVICLSSVTFVHATQPVELFCNVSVWYLGHLLTFTKNFTQNISGEPLHWEG